MGWDRRAFTRRTLLADAGVWLAAAATTGCRGATRPDPAAVAVTAGGAPIASSAVATPETRAASDVLDEVLARWTSFAPVYAGGLADHGPMAAEALLTLGFREDVARFVDHYAPRLERWSASKDRVTEGDWRSALGKPDRVTDWRDFFGEELKNGSYKDVLLRWVPRLAPGVSGSAAHGLIRIAHIVRAIARRETDLRLGELATALAYSASSYHALTDIEGESAHLGVEQALLRVALVPRERRAEGSIVDRLSPLAHDRTFARVADLVDTSGDPSELVSAMTCAFARVYCREAENRDGRIARLHAVTGASALRPILPYLPGDSQKALLRYVWQLDAAVFATHTSGRKDAQPIVPFATSNDLIAAAVDTLDEHAIKLTEVAMRENAVHADPAYFLAAAHWVRASRG